MQENQNTTLNDTAENAAQNVADDAQAAESVVLTPEERIEALEKELAESREQTLRALADIENLRRRHTEELASSQKYAINKFAQELVPVKDYLEMALLDQSGQIDTLKMGVDMTLKQLAAAFDKAQIREVSPKAGDKLDPHLHQAMSAEESDAEPNTIVRVLQKGYLLAERTLRPAMVVVAKAKA
ncbi:nucleotide exchange factor GrpE [uncultured Aquitalea sp.]|uniref:nucleotide exchange factor GrpE n=1 Tax=uncultured Aquitalea sp. TaxID=540272 RepID=UPI0025E85F3D|nr:nucleotide exchange factor GrpE [uncultured Aquitalea sp.]